MHAQFVDQASLDELLNDLSTSRPDITIAGPACPRDLSHGA
jgi:hypothetical protein